MGRPSFLLLIIAAAVAGWIALNHFEIRGLDSLKLVRRDGSVGAGGRLRGDGSDRETIRIASFNIQSCDCTKTANTGIMEVLARLIREFDVVAIQEVCSVRPDVLTSLLDRVNETGRDYSILAGHPVGRASRQERYMYIFDQERIETDRSAAYTVDDPDDLLQYPPLVGWFRVRGPAPEKAFTFTLVNVHIDPGETQYETRELDAVFYAVRDDGRGEDDLIMLGDFHVDDQHLGDLAEIPAFHAAIAGTPTNTLQTAQYDNLVFQLSATAEYVGRSGVFDFMREFNLTLEQALQVSDHLPVWAEFSTREGGDEPAVVAAEVTVHVR